MAMQKDKTKALSGCITAFLGENIKDNVHDTSRISSGILFVVLVTYD